MTNLDKVKAIKCIIQELVVNQGDWNVTKVKKALLPFNFNTNELFNLLTYPEFCRSHSAILRKNLRREKELSK